MVDGPYKFCRWPGRRDCLLGNMGDRGGGGRGERTDVEEHHGGRGETTMEGRDKCQDHWNGGEQGNAIIDENGGEQGKEIDGMMGSQKYLYSRSIFCTSDLFSVLPIYFLYSQSIFCTTR